MTRLQTGERDIYRQYILFYDLSFSRVILPASFGIVLMSLWRGHWLWFAAPPAAFDTLKSIWILVPPDRFPNQTNLAGWIGGTSTLLKWCRVAAVAMLIAIGLVRNIRAERESGF